MPVDRSLEDILLAQADTIHDELRVSLPGVITKVHVDKQTVDVQITVKNPLFDEHGNAIFEQLTSIADVPLAVTRGGGFLVWVPVAVGDSVMLVFSDLSMDTWRAGDGSRPVPPGWVGKHTADSAIAYPCVAPDSKSLSSPSADKVVIGKDSGPTQISISAADITATAGGVGSIKVTASDVQLGANPTDFAALASKVDANFMAVTSALAAGFAAAVPMDGGKAAFGAAMAAFIPAPTGSLIVKAK